MRTPPDLPQVESVRGARRPRQACAAVRMM